MATPDHQERAPRLALPVACALDVRNTLGESPVWASAENALYWVDILEATVHRWEPASAAHATWRVLRRSDAWGCGSAAAWCWPCATASICSIRTAATSRSSTIPSPTSRPTG